MHSNYWTVNAKLYKNSLHKEDIDRVNDKSLEIYLFFTNASNKLHLDSKIMQTGHGSKQRGFFVSVFLKNPNKGIHDMV